MSLLSKPSFLASALQGILIFVFLLMIIFYFSSFQKMNLYQISILILLLSISIGIHALSHLGLESTYHFYPLDFSKKK